MIRPNLKSMTGFGRAEAQTPAFRAKLRTRAGIEATLSELVRAHGLRRHRYRGDAKRHLEHLLKAAACSFSRTPSNTGNAASMAKAIAVNGTIASSEL